MNVRAISKNIRISPSKVRLVLNEIKTMKPGEAVKILDHINKSAAKPIKKVVLSAMANAENNNNLDEQSLKFSEVQVGPGTTLKRYRAISRGRPHTILKRTSNIRIELEGVVKKETKVTKEPKEPKDNKTSGSSVTSVTSKNKENAK